MADEKKDSIFGKVNEIVLPDGTIRVGVMFQHTDGSGRLWTSGANGDGKTRESAVQDLQAEVARRPLQFAEMIARVLENEKPKAGTEIPKDVDLTVLSMTQLLDIATKRGLKVTATATKPEVIKQIQDSNEF